ncbi:uncharacterized protein LOC111294722 [Durio zibethinus]|uniref:Uncharacterized protein LOC111294722 n=1 Tax=Durio zibethinus TaxID=66656 RepID=A0A6P5YUF5_DURZI|nr:uncharacterized protein LOC111294722 [Durio zibethinus]
MNICCRDTSVVPLARNLSASLEDERDLTDDVLENSECHNGEDSTVISEAGSHKSDNLDCHSALKDTKDAFPNEKTDEPEGEDKLGDIPNGILDPKGSDNIAVSEDSYEIDNLTEELIAENNGGSHADETNSIDILVADTIEDISEKVLDHSSSAEFMEPIEGSAEEYANHAPQEIECQKLVGKDCDTNAVHDALAKLPKAEGDVDGKASQNVSVLPKGYMVSSEKMENEDDDPNEIVPESNIVDAFLGDSDIDDDTGSDNNSLADELQEEVSCEQKGISIPTAAYSSEDPMTSNMVDEEALVEVNVADELQEEVSCEQKGISIPTAAYSSEDPMTSNMVDEEALVEVNVADAEIIHVSSFHNAFQSVMDDIPVHKMLDYGDAEALVDVCVKSEPMTSNMVDEEALVDVNIADAEIIHVSSFHNALQSVVDDMEDGEALVDVNVADAEIINVSSFHNAFQSVMDDIPVHKMLDCGDAKALVDVCVKSEPMTGNMVDEEALVDVNVADAEIIHVSSFHNALQSVMDDIPVHKMLDYGDAEALVDVCVKSEPMTSNMVDAEALVDVCVKSEVMDDIPVHKMLDCGDAKALVDVCVKSEPMTGNMVDEEALVDVNVADAEIIHVSSFHNALQSVMDDIPVHKMLDYGDAEALVDVCVKSEPMTSNMVDAEALVDVCVKSEVMDDIPVHKMLDYGDAEALVDVCVKSEPMTSNMVDEEALVDVNVADAEIIQVSSFHNAFQSVVDDMEDGEALVHLNVADAEIINVSSFHNALQSVMDDIPVHKMLDYGDAEALVDVCVKSEPMTGNMVDEEALVDVNVADADIIHVSSFHNALQSVEDDIPVHKMLDYGDAEALVAVRVKPVEEFAEAAQEILPEEKTPTAAKPRTRCPSLFPNSAITTSMPLSPLTAQFSQLTRFTPRKSSSKKQTTIPKVTQVSDNNNKENIDKNNSAKEVTEPSLGKMKKNKNIVDEETMQQLESMSLRNLKKLTKKFDKLQITGNMKNKEDKNDSKAFGETIPALQTLPQN